MINPNPPLFDDTPSPLNTTRNKLYNQELERLRSQFPYEKLHVLENNAWEYALNMTKNAKD